MLPGECQCEQMQGRDGRDGRMCVFAIIKDSSSSDVINTMNMLIIFKNGLISRKTNDFFIRNRSMVVERMKIKRGV